MIRAALLAAVYALPCFANANCISAPGHVENCVRAMACIGTQGLYFDGVARGWNRGTIQGHISDGTHCAGMWRSGGLFGSGTAQLTCDDGVEIGLLYHSQDGQTGTVIGSGSDSLGRYVRGWSGENVLQFMTDGPNAVPQLPCQSGPIPLS